MTANGSHLSMRSICFRARDLSILEQMKNALWLRSYLASVLSLVLLFGPVGARTETIGLESKIDLKRDLENRALRFFVDHTHPITGLARDSAKNFIQTPSTNRMASLASTGFALAVIANAGERGLVDRKFARGYALKTLRFARDHVPRYKGWFLHFVDWETGARWGESEYSTIDTALFLAGALYAARVFPGGEIARIAEGLYRETDFIAFLTDAGSRPDKLTLSMAYTPERGFTPAQWSMSAEQIILLLLGLGHPMRPLPPAAWLAWNRNFTWTPSGMKMVGAEQALFVHQYSQLFVDLRGFRDRFTFDYHDNGRIATLYNRETCLGDTKYGSFRSGFWGLSAGFSSWGYTVYSPTHYDSIVCIGCAAGSIVFAPEVVLADIENWKAGPYGARIWGRYGFVDSLDLDRDWIAEDVLGITVGPIYMSLANLNTRTSIWRKFAKIPGIRRGLAAAAAAR